MSAVKIIFTAIVLHFIFYNFSIAQRIVRVNPGYGTLNNAINNDTGRDEFTVYELQRNGFYITSGTIENKGYTLNIWAEEGEGERPIIKPGVDQGGLSVNSFSPRGDLFIKNLNIRNVDLLGNSLPNMIRCISDSILVRVEGCWLDSTGQAFFRFDGDWMRLKIKDSQISNSYGNGYRNSRGIDDRKNNVDSVSISNTTFYNILTLVREGGGGTTMFYEFDHCTLYHIGKKIAILGKTVETHFTNNLIVNSGLLGRDSLGSIMELQDDNIFRVEPLSGIYTIGLDQIFKFRHNLFYRDNAYENYPFPRSPDGDLVEFPIPIFDNHSKKLFEYFNGDETWYSKPITFTNAPPIDTMFIHNFWYDVDADNDDRLGTDIPAPFNNEGKPFDFSYGTDEFAYTAAEGNFPLGDLNWFPDIKTKWDNGEILTSYENNFTQSPDKVQLYQNYPNPFNPSTTISYSLTSESMVKLTIYDALGRLVVNLINSEIRNAGIHKLIWNGKNSDGNKISNNILFIQLEVDNKIITNKMIILK